MAAHLVYIGSSMSDWPGFGKLIDLGLASWSCKNGLEIAEPVRSGRDHSDSDLIPAIFITWTAFRGFWSESASRPCALHSPASAPLRSSSRIQLAGYPQNGSPGRVAQQASILAARLLKSINAAYPTSCPTAASCQLDAARPFFLGSTSTT